MHRFVADQVTGKFGASIGEAWFKFVGYTLIASIFQAADMIANNFLVASCKWGSYIALYMWLRHEFEKVMYYIWPTLAPKPENLGKYKEWQFLVANSLAPMLTFIAFSIGLSLADVFESIKP